MNRPLDDYVRRLLAAARGLSPRERRELAAETRAHLEDRAAHHAAAGLGRVEAETAACAEFGDAETLGEEWAMVRRGSFARSLILGLAVFGAVFAVNLVSFTSAAWPGQSRAAVLFSFLFFLGGGPLLGGYATGAVARRFPVRAALAAFAFWAAGFVRLDAVASTDPGEWQGVLAALAFVSLPLAGLGAAHGARARRGRAEAHATVR